MSARPVMNLKNCHSARADGFVKLYARGKMGLLFKGPQRHRKVAQQCFRRALDVSVRFDHILFVEQMRDCGLPEMIIRQFLDSCTIIDEVRLDEAEFSGEG